MHCPSTHLVTELSAQALLATVLHQVSSVQVPVKEDPPVAMGGGLGADAHPLNCMRSSAVAPTPAGIPPQRKTERIARLVMGFFLGYATAVRALLRDNHWMS
jgi:hypothetical protein